MSPVSAAFPYPPPAPPRPEQGGHRPTGTTGTAIFRAAVWDDDSGLPRCPTNNEA
jgi:hypothetical protein